MEKTEIRFFAEEVRRDSGKTDLKVIADQITKFCVMREDQGKMIPNIIGMMNSIQMHVCQGPGPDHYPFVVVMVVSMAQIAPGRIQ